MWKVNWSTQHECETKKRYILSPRQELNPWPPEYQHVKGQSSVVIIAYISSVFFIRFSDDNLHDNKTQENYRDCHNNGNVSSFLETLELHWDLVKINGIRFNQKSSSKWSQMITGTINKSVQRCW